MAARPPGPGARRPGRRVSRHARRQEELEERNRDHRDHGAGAGGRPSRPRRHRRPRRGSSGWPRRPRFSSSSKLGVAGTTRGVFSTKPRNVVVAQEPAAGSDASERLRGEARCLEGTEAGADPGCRRAGRGRRGQHREGAGPRTRRRPVPSDQPPGQVIAQHPVAGTLAAAGSGVRLNVSSGKSAPAQPTTVDGARQAGDRHGARRDRHEASRGSQVDRKGRARHGVQACSGRLAEGHRRLPVPGARDDCQARRPGAGERFTRPSAGRRRRPVRSRRHRRGRGVRDPGPAGRRLPGLLSCIRALRTAAENGVVHQAEPASGPACAFQIQGDHLRGPLRRLGGIHGTRSEPDPDCRWSDPDLGG